MLKFCKNNHIQNDNNSYKEWRNDRKKSFMGMNLIYIIHTTGKGEELVGHVGTIHH